MARDGSSGGVIRLCIVEKDKVERMMIPGFFLNFYFNFFLKEINYHNIHLNYNNEM